MKMSEPATETLAEMGQRIYAQFTIGQSNRGYPNPTRKETPTATNSEADRKWLNDSMGASENTFDAQVEADNLHPR
jgi:hypothetical protein